MIRLIGYLISLYILYTVFHVCHTFTLFPQNREIKYEVIAKVRVEALRQYDDDETPAPASTSWEVRGTLKIQRRNNETIAASLVVENLVLTNPNQIFYQNKEMVNLYYPFRIVWSDDVINHIVFHRNDTPWSSNFKRAIASSIQIQGNEDGVITVLEPTIHGTCNTEYRIVRDGVSYLVTKTSNLMTCSPHQGGIHNIRSNVPRMACYDEYFQKNVITASTNNYELLPHSNESGDYYLKRANVEGIAIVHTFESTGEAQHITSTLSLVHLSETEIINIIDIDKDMSEEVSTLIYVEKRYDPTGGRQPKLPTTVIRSTYQLLLSMADTLENNEIKFEDPYDDRVTTIIDMMSYLNYTSLTGLYNIIDIGTSYRQETVRNIFLDILPRIGTKASVLLTRDLVSQAKVPPITAMQLLIFLPAHITELSADLVVECESLLSIASDRTDVRHIGVLSYATLIHHTYVAGKITTLVFEKYVRKYYNMYASSFDYEQKMIYIQGLGNLQLAPIGDYLEPIIRNDAEETDIRYHAIWATMPGNCSRLEKVSEIYWPIFINQTAPLELRVSALIMLLNSNPTPGKLLVMERLMQTEGNRHLINFYRTTILSLTKTSYPCYQNLKRLLSYVSRNVPKSPGIRFWTTGNYVFDYRDYTYGIGDMFHAYLIGNERTDLPMIGIFEFNSEALGKVTSQLSLFVKFRGLDSTKLNKIFPLDRSYNRQIVDLFKKLNLKQTNPDPLHLELIVQIEGKTVASLFLNEKLLGSSQIDISEVLNQIYRLLREGSHINMQIVRWPFMQTYSVPTILGTSAEITLQSTVFASLRGNLTEIRPNIRSNQIDTRYSSYALCKSTSYNPFLNLLHSVQREQGYIFYLPINNEFSIDRSDSFSFGFDRPANITNGISLKSRSVTSTTGYILRDDSAPYSDIIYSDRNGAHDSPLSYTLALPLLGFEVNAQTNLIELMNHIQLLFSSDINGNSRVVDWTFFTEYLIMNAAIIQLNSIHVGNNKKFVLLFNNKDNIRLDGDFSYTQNSLNLSHTINSNIKFKSETKLSTKKNTTFSSTLTVFKRNRRPEWGICLDGLYEPMQFMNRPDSVSINITYGLYNGLADRCPDTDSFETLVHSTADLTYGDLYDSAENFEHESVCPREILKFTPPPKSLYCNRKTFPTLTAQTHYNATVTFNGKMPEPVTILLNRLDHFLSTFSNDPMTNLNLTTGINASIIAMIHKLMMNVYVNDRNCIVPNIILLYDLIHDAKYDSSEQMSVNAGYSKLCSIVQDNLTTFNDTTIRLKSPGNCSATLLLADCSDLENPMYAVILKPRPNNRYLIELQFIYDNFIEIESGDKDIGTIKVNGDVLKFDKEEDYRNIEFSSNSSKEISQNVLVGESDGIVVVINSDFVLQFDYKNLLTLRIDSFIYRRTCGSCSFPQENYQICEIDKN